MIEDKIVKNILADMVCDNCSRDVWTNSNIDGIEESWCIIAFNENNTCERYKEYK